MASNIEEDDYFLKWEKHHSAFVTFFSGLFRRSMLVDCTLAAEEKFIKAHRIVLMACSPYFEELLSDHCDNFPIVFLNIKFSELKSIVDFCYRGEVKISYNDIDGFLNAANLLQIRGLSDPKSKSTEKPLGSSGKLKRRRSTVSNSIGEKSELKDSDSAIVDNMGDSVSAMEDEEDEENSPKKQKVLTPEMLESLAKDLQTSEETQGSDISDVDTDDDSESSIQGDTDINLDVNELLMQATGSLMFPWSCNRCGEAFASRNPYQEHRKVCHAVPSDHKWRCEDCPNTYKNKKDLIRHLNYCGQEQPRLECDRCGQTYKYDRGLKRHQQYCGTDVEPLKCPECDKTYKYKRGLRRHQRKCVIIRALDFLQKKGVAPNAVLPPDRDKEREKVKEKMKEKEKEKDKKAISALATLVCSCGKSYKYEKAFKRHRLNCSGLGLNHIKEEYLDDD